MIRRLYKEAMAVLEGVDIITAERMGDYMRIMNKDYQVVIRQTDKAEFKFWIHGYHDVTDFRLNELTWFECVELIEKYFL